MSRLPDSLDVRVEVVSRRDAYDRDPAAFLAKWDGKDRSLRRRISAARQRLAAVDVPLQTLQDATRLCMALGTDGLRGELTLVRTARALAALDGDETVEATHLRRIAIPALSHRLRRNPLDDSSSVTRVERALREVLGP